MYKCTLPHTPPGRKMPFRHSALRTEYCKWTVCLILLDRILPVKFEKLVNQLQDLIYMLLYSPNQQWWIWLIYICRTLQILAKLVVYVLWLSNELGCNFQYHLNVETYPCQACLLVRSHHQISVVKRFFLQIRLRRHCQQCLQKMSVLIICI